MSGTVTLWTLYRKSGVASCELELEGSVYALTIRYRGKPFLRTTHRGLPETVTRAAVMREELEGRGWEDGREF